MFQGSSTPAGRTGTTDLWSYWHREAIRCIDRAIRSILCTALSAVMELARVAFSELACFKVLPRPEGVLARSFCDRTGIAKRYGVLFIYREPGTGNWEHSLVFFIDTVPRAKLGNMSNSPFGRGGAQHRGG